MRESNGVCHQCLSKHRHYLTDVHATILHQLGLDSSQLEVPGRKRLAIDHGAPIREIIA